MIFFKGYLLEENARLRKRVEHLEARIDEITDAKIFNRLPERLAKDVKIETNHEASGVPGDAYSVAIEDAKKRSESKTEE